MFGNKNAKTTEPAAADTARVVPVYTVHSLPQPYEVLCTVYSGRISNSSPVNLLQQLGLAGGAVSECDAVIGILLTPGLAAGTLNAYGTAIRYV
ncbi:hypothetical protein [Paenibacillus sp. CF384]|uniref:hypothetical protein n=1 Tax=Paenibacillus sp. CF384 TaxID=1884382 RepID=UPI00089A7A5F|nr:hypothetical protein [Paenibacillus sp. CF384]SDX56742.1 hypothetical protein SAMN05518855_1016116 [Paenibacillus sp. CF384]